MGFANLDIFTWVAVNESIEKINDDWIPKDRLLKEWTMPVYNPLMQMSKFYQNSVFFHLYWNPHLLKSKYVGFAQYDMAFDVDALGEIINKIGEDDGGDKIFGAYPYVLNTIYDILGAAEWEECFMKPYNDYYSTMHRLEDISTLPLLLLHTFIMPKWFFLHMMGFVDKMYVGILRALGWNTQHLAGTLERVLALCIGFGIKENKFRIVKLWSGVNHIDSQHTGDSFRGITVGKGLLKQ
jgi:hypothetical protein